MPKSFRDTACRALAAALLAAGGAAGAATPTKAPAVPATPGYEQQFASAQQLAHSGQREEAIRAYTAMLGRWPGNSDILLGRGQVYSWMKRWPEAERDLRAAIAVSPRRADAWSALGNVYAWSDRPAQAAEAYGKWVALKPQDPEALIARGRAWRAAGDYGAARADFEAAGRRGADPKAIADLLASLAPRAVPEAQVPAGYTWSALASGGWTDWSPDRASWGDYTVSLRRHFERGSLAAELIEADHFGASDNGWALDAYADVWPRAYVNLRYQQNPSGGILPDQAYRVELWQGMGKGWEPSVSYDRLEFGSTNVDMFGLGIGYYTGPFYLRWKHLYTLTDTSHGNSDRLLGRWYYAGNGDDYLELGAGFGVSTQDVVGTPGATANRRNSSMSVAVVRYFTPHWGAKLGASYGDEYLGFVGRQVGVSLYARW